MQLKLYQSEIISVLIIGLLGHSVDSNKEIEI